MLLVGYLIIQWPVVMFGCGLAFILMFVVIRKIVAMPIQKYSVRRLEALSETIKNVNQTNGAIKMIKINRLEGAFQKTFMDSVRKVRDYTIKTDTLGMLPKIILENVGMSLVFFMVMVIIMLGNNIVTLMPIVATFGLVMYKIIPGISRITTYYAQIMQYSPSLDVMMEARKHTNSDEVIEEKDYLKEKNFFSGIARCRV